jgi:hypothetical protein
MGRRRGVNFSLQLLFDVSDNCHHTVLTLEKINYN